MSKNEQVKELWHFVYDLVHGPGRNHTIIPALMLVERFDEGLMNEIAGITKLSGDELMQTIEDVRAKLHIAQATGVIGTTDMERINGLLDKIT